MAVIGRLLAMMLAYALSCVAASAVFTLGMLSPGFGDLAAAGLPPPAVWAIIAVGAVVIGVAALLPTMLVVVAAEALAWRSILLYGVLGGVVALFLSYGLDLSGDIAQPETYLSRERELYAASGIAGGLVYWLIAGRCAGAWTSKERRKRTA